MNPRKKDILIGISYFNHVQTHLWGFYDYFFRAYAEKKGIKIISREAHDQADIQINQLQELIEQRIDVLIIAVQSSDHPALIAKVRQIMASGIPVLALDSEIGNGDYTCLIGADNFNSQKTIADYAFTKLNGKGKVAYLQGIPELRGAKQRMEGFHAALANYPDIELIWEEPTFYGITPAIETTTKCLQQHPDIDAIIAANDFSAFGAIEAIEKSGITKHILVTGYDGHREAPYAIRQGKLTATINYSPHRLAELSMEMALRALNGEAVPKHTFIDIILITPGNLEETATSSLGALPSFMQNIILSNAQLEKEIQERKQNQAMLQAYAQKLEQRDEQRKQDQATLKAYADKLERRNEELQKFAHITSHDLREPLRKIQIFSDLLQTHYADALDQRGTDYLERILKASGHMDLLINDILIFSRVTEKDSVFHPINLDLILHEVLDEMNAFIRRNNAKIIMDVQLTLNVNPIQMKQLFHNLISNAIKFKQDDLDPLIHITGQKIENDMIQIMVADNGIGFEPAYGERIFGMFQRLYGRSSYEGTGIGLAICRKIVEAHHGTIMATGVAGKGATFTITLPTTQP